MRASKMLWGLVLGACLVGGSLLAAAQQAGMKQPADPKAIAMSRLDSMANQLKLTDEQKEKLKPILTTEAEDAAAIKNNTSLNQTDKRKRMMELHEKYSPQINAVLTPEQQEKWKAMKKEAWEEHKEKMGGMEHQ